MQTLNTRRTAERSVPAYSRVELYAVTDTRFLLVCLNYCEASNVYTAVQRQPLL